MLKQKLFDGIFKHKGLNLIGLKTFVFMHNFSYKIISILVTLRNNGLHPKHQIINYHQFFVDHTDLEDSVLDLGCGNGANTHSIAQKAKQVVGIDTSEKSIKYAQEYYQRPNLKFVHGDINTYKFDTRFDKIILSNVLEHIEDRAALLPKLHHISDTVLLRVPMITRDWLAVYKKDLGLEYRLDSSHFIEYNLTNLKEELNQANWKITSYEIKFGEFLGVLKYEN